jgi:hypothetical protein
VIVLVGLVVIVLVEESRCDSSGVCCARAQITALYKDERVHPLDKIQP